MGRWQVNRGNVILWAMFCGEIWGLAIIVDVILTHTTCLSIVADHVPPFVEMLCPDVCGLFQQANALCHKAKNGSEMI